MLYKNEEKKHLKKHCYFDYTSNVTYTLYDQDQSDDINNDNNNVNIINNDISNLDINNDQRKIDNSCFKNLNKIMNK